jgi:hypothetical protein
MLAVDEARALVEQQGGLGVPSGALELAGLLAQRRFHPTAQGR